LSKSDKTLEKVISALEEDSNSLINWFSANKMQANPEKFQAISVGCICSIFLVLCSPQKCQVKGQ
jgi:hypothetical protein